MKIAEFRDFGFKYQGSGEAALSGVGFSIEEGALSVLCGKSGCGKTTLLLQLKGSLAPHGESSGEILYRGRPIRGLGAREESAEIGLVRQNPESQVVTDKVWHEMAFGLESLGMDNATIRLRVAEMASYFGMQEWFYKDVRELSGGQRQLLCLASVMVMHPRLLVLDEPTAQLDPVAASEFFSTIIKINRDMGTTVLISEQRLCGILPDADQAIVLDGGRLLCDGPPREVGAFLKGRGHGMFLSMPVPMRIYAESGSDAPCPLTVGEGRRWLDGLMRGSEKIGDDAPPAETPRGGILANKAQSGGKLSPPARTPRSPRGAPPPAIQVREAWFRYEREGRDVARDFSLSVGQGEFYALLGANGAGKSTALSLISRVRQPYRGRIRIFGKDIRKYGDGELCDGCIGVLPQDPKTLFLKKTVLEDLYDAIGGKREGRSRECGHDMKKAEAVRGMARLTGLEGLMGRHPYDLSGGEQQRLALAKVLLRRPRILLLDEPTKGLDGEFKRDLGILLKKLQSHGMTILMASHDLEFVAEYADRAGLFFQGSVVAEKGAREFFAGNAFYTTDASRMARERFPSAVTAGEVAECIREAGLGRTARTRIGS